MSWNRLYFRPTTTEDAINIAAKKRVLYSENKVN